MIDWREIIQARLEKQKNKVAQINLDKETVNYSEEIKSHRNLKSLTGDEEVVRAFLIDRLVNELDYKAQYIETEKEYTIKGGHSKITPRIDVIVKDDDGNPFFFIEAKAPNKYESDKSEIEGQLFALAQAEEKDFKTKVKYLVYYTTEEQDSEILDKAIIIDFTTYNTYEAWEKDGNVSIAIELTAGYGEPKKQPLIKGDEKHDLRTKINREEIEGLGRNLHNVLWGGGGTNDSEIFYSLVNIILAKIQDEYEKEDGQEYDFQIYQYGSHIESQNKMYDRINTLYKRALKIQLNVSDQQKIDDDNVINRNKFPLNKLVYAVQALENLSFLEGRNSLNDKDILGDFFESITRDGFKQDGGQFFTPTPIVNFLLYGLQLDSLSLFRLNEDRELPLIIDPSAGSGTYLVEAMKLITKEIKYKQREKVKTSRQTKQRFEELFTPDHNENKWAREYLYGSEINFDLGTSSKVNMILHGDGSTNIFVKDGLLPFRFYVKESSPNYLETSNAESIYNEKEVNGKFDIAISNPPFNVDLDKQTQKEIKNTFLFGEKKNSENLFIERYYQLLKEGGRLGVVLPESVFDTTENKYIRLFLFKYFNIKAVVSLPQLTFDPHTKTKTSILFAQKKTKKQVEKWNDLWNKYGKEWSSLVTRLKDYTQFFVEEKKLNKKWAKDVVKDIEDNNTKNLLDNIYRFLKDYITIDDKKLSVKEILEKYSSEIISLYKYEKEYDVFGYYNVWWVFGEVSKELNYDIFMAEAENVGYKRSKRSEKLMPNDLYDIEYAPQTLETDKIIEQYSKQIKHQKDKKNEIEKTKSDLEKKIKSKSSVSDKEKLRRIIEDIDTIDSLIEDIESEIKQIDNAFQTFYERGKLKEKYHERTDIELIDLFSKGILKKYKSEDIILREKEEHKILDAIRKQVSWE